MFQKAEQTTIISLCLFHVQATAQPALRRIRRTGWLEHQFAASFLLSTKIRNIIHVPLKTRQAITTGALLGNYAVGMHLSILAMSGRDAAVSMLHLLCYGKVDDFHFSVALLLLASDKKCTRLIQSVVSTSTVRKKTTVERKHRPLYIHFYLMKCNWYYFHSPSPSPISLSRGWCKASTECFHFTRLAAIVLASFHHSHSSSFLSFSTVCLQVVFRLPLLLFPFGAHAIAML